MLKPGGSLADANQQSFVQNAHSRHINAMTCWESPEDIQKPQCECSYIFQVVAMLH